MTKLQCCPTSDGAAAAILMSEEFVHKYGLEKQAVEVCAMEMVTDVEASFDGSCINAVGFAMSKKAADDAYRKSGLTANDVQVIELHDCFSANELITYEALGLCPIGKAGELIDRNDNTYGGKWVVNPSGGLISKGHPLGATGLAQCTELCWQLRGLADKRQVPGAKVALQHNIGLGGAVVVTLYRLGFSSNNSPTSSGKSGNIDLKSSPLYDEIAKNLQDSVKANEMKQKINGVICFKIGSGSGSHESWIIDLKSASPSITRSSEPKGDCIITIDDTDLLELAAGNLMPQKAFFQGKLKISGNMGLATKVQVLLKARPRL